MNTKYMTLVFVAVGGAAAAAAPPGHAARRTQPSTGHANSATTRSGPRVVDRWDGTSAFAYAGTCQPVYALSLTNASYVKRPGAIETDTCGFQCVELAVRYFNYRKGIPVASWQLVGTAVEMCSRRVPGVTRTSHPAPGDLVVLKANDAAMGTGPAGHVAIVTGVHGDTISTFNQNWARDTTARGTASQKNDVLCILHAGR